MARRRAKRGTGSVYYAKGVRRWCADYPTGVRRNGRALRERKFFTTQGEAEAELERMAERHRRPGDVAVMRMDEYLDYWMASYEGTIRASTAESYRRHIRMYIKPVLGQIELGRLTAPDVRLLMREAGKKVKPATVHRIVATLSSAIETAKDDGAIEVNVARNVRKPRVERAPVAAMTPATAKAILAAVKDDEHEALYRLLLGSGIRVGEAIGLDWGDVRERHVLVRVSKTKVRTVPISADARQALAELKLRCSSMNSSPVFTGVKSGRRLDATVATHHFGLVLERAGLPHMRVHDLRHGVASLMLASGKNLKIVQEQLGHSSMVITSDLYSHLTPEAQSEALDDAMASVSR